MKTALQTGQVASLELPQRTPPPSVAHRLWRDTVRYLGDADAMLGRDGRVHRRQVVRF